MRIFNSNIKVHILYLSILLNLSSIKSIKQKSTLSLVLSMLDLAKYNPQSFPYQIKPEKDQYLANSSLSNQFITDIQNNDKSNNAITIIERLFLNIRYRLFYKSLTEKTIYEICKFFIYFARHISFKD